MPCLGLHLDSHTMIVGGVCGGVVAAELMREVHGLSASRKRHVAPWDDVSSSPSGAHGAAADEKPSTLVCTASCCIQTGTNSVSSQRKQLSMHQEA